MTTINPSPSTVSYESIKLGIDAHAKYYWVSRQVDGPTPQPVQKMTYDELILFVVKQQKLTRNVVTCYEAGAFGVHLHRRFEELGIKNYVVQPQDWDERGKGVKNGRLDAAALCQRLGTRGQCSFSFSHGLQMSFASAGVCTWRGASGWNLSWLFIM